MMKSGVLFFVLKVILLVTALVGCNSRIELLQGVSESEANEALAALLDGGIRAGKLPGKEGMVGLEVDANDVAKAIAILRSEGLPKERYAKMGEVFRKEGLISSPLEERARYLWALSQELSATVSQIDGVIKARVHVVLPERSNAGDPSLPSSAAVFIKHKASINLDDAVPQVKKLISNSIPGLSADKVAVILLASGVKSADDNVRQNNSLPNSSQASLATTAARESLGSSRKTELNPILIWAACGGFVLMLLGLGYAMWRKWGVFPKKTVKAHGLSTNPSAPQATQPEPEKA